MFINPHHTPNILQPRTQPQKIQQPRKPKRKDTQVPQSSDHTNNVVDEAVHKELGECLVRAATTASSLEAGQDSGNITKTRSKTTPNESSSLRTTSGGSPGCQETIGDTIAQTMFENVSKESNDSLLARGNILRSDDDRLKLDELMALCTTLQNRVLDLEKTKTTQHNEIVSLKRSIKKLEKNKAEEIIQNEDITLVNVQYDEMLDVDALHSEEVFVAKQKVATTTTATITTEEITLAQALEALKPKDKGKVIMIEEPGKPKQKVQIMLDEEAVLKLQAEFDEEERLVREKAKKEQEANIALIETWDDIQAKIDVDHQLAERLQAQEEEELSDAKKATLFPQLL
nr:hypothetical protein [Tanacetum cinerariifolium]